VSTLIAKDHAHLWHPCAQMKDYEIFKPLIVTGAKGSYIQLAKGKKIIDAISSWWCKSLGHQHPQLKKKLLQQIEKFEHVILANTTNEVIVNLSEKLANLTSDLKKVMYASDGSCVIEMAMKMSVHARIIEGKTKRKNFIALKNSFHGETIGAMSVSDVGIYKDPYHSLVFKVDFIDVPYCSGIDDPIWENCDEAWESIIKQLEPLSEKATAIIVEPIIQAAGQMRIYSKDFLKKLRNWTKKNDIHLIADEVMTGIGRTGKMLASEHANITPDFLCLGKGLTAGWLPLSALLMTDAIYYLFYDDYENGNNFLHSHTFSGNALAASIALEVLNIMKKDKMPERVLELGKVMFNMFLEIADKTKKLINIRGIGGVVAADLILAHEKQRLGYDIYQKAIRLGALLRPLGNTIYWAPPFNIEIAVLTKLKNITQQAIEM